MTQLLPAFFIPVLFLFSSSLYSQSDSNHILIRGKIIDSNGKPIAYANIGIPAKDIGTVSDISGNFEIKIPKEFLSEKLEISSIGYQSRNYTIQELVNSDSNQMTEIKLEILYQSLQDIVIVPNQMRTKVLGNTTRSTFMSGGFSSNDLGGEAGTRIKIKKEVYLQKVDFHISFNKLDSIKLRLNIYAMHNGEPGENILPENIIVQLLNKQTGNIEIDLSKYKIRVHDDILVAFEFIEGKGNVKSGVFVSASLLGAPTYYRTTSQAKWKEYKGISIGINVTVKYPSNSNSSF